MPPYRQPPGASPLPPDIAEGLAGAAERLDDLNVAQRQWSAAIAALPVGELVARPSSAISKTWQRSRTGGEECGAAAGDQGRDRTGTAGSSADYRKYSMRSVQ